jgi:hypothetical protein
VYIVINVIAKKNNLMVLFGVSLMLGLDAVLDRLSAFGGRLNMAWAKYGRRYILMWVALLSFGCSNETPIGPMRDCSADGIGCSSGFVCVLMDGNRHRCVIEDASTDALVPRADAETVDVPDALMRVDVALPTDRDDDRVEDLLDNCPDSPNADQEDRDGDGLGDACDSEPNVQNLFLSGQFLTLGGTSDDENYTVKSKITTGAGELTDGQLIMTGVLNP